MIAIAFNWWIFFNWLLILLLLFKIPKHRTSSDLNNKKTEHNSSIFLASPSSTTKFGGRMQPIFLLKFKIHEFRIREMNNHVSQVLFKPTWMEIYREREHTRLFECGHHFARCLLFIFFIINCMLIYLDV